MARPLANLRFGVLLLAFLIAVFLWSVAHGSRDAEKGFDIPTELVGLDETLVVTDRSVDSVNIRVLGSRAALNNLQPSELAYNIDVSGAKPGVAEYEVNLVPVEANLPRNTRIVSRSPSSIQVRFERRGRKAVGVRADIEGSPREGLLLEGVEIDPPRVWLTGARSQVLRVNEVVTEPIDISGFEESGERKVRIVLGGGTVWLEENEPVTARIQVEPDPEFQVPGTEESEAVGEEPGPA